MPRSLEFGRVVLASLHYQSHNLHVDMSIAVARSTWRKGNCRPAVPCITRHKAAS